MRWKFPAWTNFPHRTVGDKCQANTISINYSALPSQINGYLWAEMFSRKLETKTADTWWYLWYKTWSSFIDCESSQSWCDKVAALRAIVKVYGPNFSLFGTMQNTMSDFNSHSCKLRLQLTKTNNTFSCLLTMMHFRALALYASALGSS